MMTTSKYDAVQQHRTSGEQLTGYIKQSDKIMNAVKEDSTGIRSYYDNPGPLSALLADELVLCLKTKVAHWNAEGPNFYSLHLLFESQFQELDKMVDLLAERIRSVGHYTPASINEYLKITHLSETVTFGKGKPLYIPTLLADHLTIIFEIKEMMTELAVKYNDEGTSSLLSNLLERHEKAAWILRAMERNE